MPTTAVLIPCCNEEQTIEKVALSYRQYLPHAEIYIYDNNSSDKTAEIARRLADNDDGIFLRHEERQGKGNVIRTMFRDIDADCYIMTDGDDTYPAGNAPEMERLILTGQADMVIGDRLSSTYFTENKRPFHNFGNVLVRSLINRLFKSHIHDIMTGFRALSRAFVKGYPVLSRKFEVETEMTIHAVDKNYRIKEIPVEYRNRPDGSKSKLNTFSDGFKVLKTIFQCFKNYRPLMFFGLTALIFFLLSGGLFIPVLIGYLNTGLVAKFPTLIVSATSMIISLLMLSLGFILDAKVKNEKRMYELLMNMAWWNLPRDAKENNK